MGRWLGCAGLAALGAGICSRAVALKCGYFALIGRFLNLQEVSCRRMRCVEMTWGLVRKKEVCGGK